ncbi:MAG: hypothetical protein IPJ74_16925 [Saprospiraceae bacterium]|nr:hypothetical protein [Saprospiraceae bacterium]
MSRNYFSVVIPTNADKLLSLADKILQKHYQDGAASKINETLAQALQQKQDIARVENVRQGELDRLKEKLNEERTLLLGWHDTQNAYTEGTVRSIVTAARDILMGNYRGNERILGDWGFVVNSPKGKVQVIIPKNADELIALAKKVMEKHYMDGGGSLLNDLPWEVLNNRLYEAEMKLEEARKANRDKEKATQTRNIALGIDKGQSSKTPNTVKYIVKSVRDLLLGTFRGREQELGDWGFEVNRNTSSAAEEREAAE